MKIGMGRTNERIGRIQETYVANATSSWLESLERSLAQMKDYQVCIGLITVQLVANNSILDCSEEVGVPPSSLRYVSRQDAESKERRF